MSTLPKPDMITGALFGQTRRAVLALLFGRAGDSFYLPSIRGNDNNNHVRLHAKQTRFGIKSKVNTAVGQIRTVVEMECVTCLQLFPMPVEVNDFAVQMDLPGTELVDLTPLIREDIVLNLPSYPHCDWNGERTCERPLAIVTDDTPEPPEIPAWEALEKLRFEKGE